MSLSVPLNIFLAEQSATYQTMTDTDDAETMRVLGSKAKVPNDCGVCGNDWSFGGWHIAHGETHCRACGATYQIRPLANEDWEDVPRHKVKDEFVDPISEFHEQTGNSVYSDQQAFEDFLETNYPDLAQ